MGRKKKIQIENKERNIWVFIKEITMIQDPNFMKTLTPNEYKEFTPFLIVKFLALNNDLTYAMSYIDKYINRGMSKEHFYKLLIKLIPKGNYWLNFEKKKKNVETPDWFMEIVKKYFIFIGKSQALFYANLLSNEQKKILAKKFGISDKQLKELHSDI